MALCNTVHYSYGKFMNVRHLQIMAKHAGQSNFTIKAYEIYVIQNYLNKPLQTNFMARQQQQIEKYSYG